MQIFTTFSYCNYFKQIYFSIITFWQLWSKYTKYPQEQKVKKEAFRGCDILKLGLFRPGLAWKPRLWLVFTWLRLCQTSSKAKATNHGLAPAWPGLGPGFIYKLLRRHENFFLVKYIIYFYFLLHSTQIMSSCSKTKINWYKKNGPTNSHL